MPSASVSPGFRFVTAATAPATAPRTVVATVDPVDGFLRDAAFFLVVFVFAARALFARVALRRPAVFRAPVARFAVDRLPLLRPFADARFTDFLVRDFAVLFFFAALDVRFATTAPCG